MYSTTQRHRPAGLAPFFHEIEGMKDRDGGSWFQEYSPSPVEKRYQRMMHRNIEEALEYRRQYEHQWEFAARRFSLLTEPIADNRLSNVLIPTIRVIMMSRLASMTKGDMDVTFIPNYDEQDKVDLWKDCRRYVGNKCNERYEMQNAYLNMTLFGSAPLMDGYRAAYQTLRIPTAQGFKEIVSRDAERSMIFTESIMPWQYLVSGGGRDHHDAPHYTYTRYMDYDQWVSEFARTPGYDGKPLYQHVRSVQPGKAYSYQYDKSSGDWIVRTHALQHRKVCVNYHFVPGMDLLMIESNGALNWTGPNPYAHKRSPFSMLRLHPQLDPSGGSMSIYGMGDPWLLNGLDTMYQNVMNMQVDNFYFANSTVIGVPQGISLDIDDEEFYGGTIIRGADQMVVNQLGRVDGQSYQFMWKMLNDLLIWATGVPFNQLVPEGNITAFELSKRIEMANERQAEVLRRNESYGFKTHVQNQMSNIFQFLPEEEFFAVTDPDAVEGMVKEGKIQPNDIVYEEGIPVMIRSFPMIETKGRVIEETFANGLPIIGKAKVVEKGRSGRLAARPETIRPTEWIRNKSIPDVQVDSMTCFGPQQEREQKETIDSANFALGRNDIARREKQPLPFNEKEVYEDVLKSMRRNPKQWMNGMNMTDGKQLTEGVNTKDVQKEMEMELSMRDRTPEEAAAMLAGGGAGQPQMPVPQQQPPAAFMQTGQAPPTPTQ